MQTAVMPLGKSKTQFVRLRFPELTDWDGYVHVSGLVEDPLGSLVVTLWSARPGAMPPSFVVEESRDGVDWAQADARVQTVTH